LVNSSLISVFIINQFETNEQLYLKLTSSHLPQYLSNHIRVPNVLTRELLVGP